MEPQLSSLVSGLVGHKTQELKTPLEEVALLPLTMEVVWETWGLVLVEAPRRIRMRWQRALLSTGLSAWASLPESSCRLLPRPPAQAVLWGLLHKEMHEFCPWS